MGRSKEDLTIYSLEEDLGRIIRDFTRHGITQPEAIGESATNTSFTVKTPEEIEAHNAQVREKLAQRASSDRPGTCPWAWARRIYTFWKSYSKNYCFPCCPYI